MEIIVVRYPENDWLLIFNDGSLLNRTHGAGAGIYSGVFNFYLPTGLCTTTAFDGEFEIIIWLADNCRSVPSYLKK